MSYPGLSLSGRIAVVVGGTSGIGRTLSLGLAEAGADVVPTSRRESEVRSTADAIRALGRKSLSVPSDVTDRSTLERLRDAVKKELGPAHILINCAGQIKRTPTLELEEAEFSRIVDTNLMGTLRGCQIFGRDMLERGYGRIVNIASLSSFVAFNEVAAYSASKAGVVSLTRSLAVEWSRRGVCVNAIAPGVFRTPLNQALLDGTPRGQELLLRTPMQRFGKFEELVGAAIFLSSESASFVSGQTLTVDGGFRASGVNQ